MTDEALLRAATALRAASPSAWAELLQALKERSLDLARQTVQAPSAMVLVAQGRAQESARLQEVLESAHEVLNKRAARKPL